MRDIGPLPAVSANGTATPLATWGDIGLTLHFSRSARILT